ncbi:MAG: transglycosylase [Desulfuromonas sp.]|nr:MAG: transglycosylase [Desulfuromonas sp.]
MYAKPIELSPAASLSVAARIMRLFSSLLFLLVCLAAAGAIHFWASLPNVANLADPQTSITISVRDWEGQEQPFSLGPQNPDWTPLEAFPEHLPWAVVVAEDGAFYKHHGIDLQALHEALIYDLQQQRMARGASTITQQLAKNLYLSREKTVLRKLREAVIAWRIENSLSKERILELYLNLVELGPMVHGITAGTRYHLDKPVTKLSSAESAFLAAILPGPRIAFNPRKRPERVAERAKKLLYFMQLRRVLEGPQYELATREVDIITGIAPRPVVQPAQHTPMNLLYEVGQRPPWQLPLATS